jgi:hypothetical protein
MTDAHTLKRLIDVERKWSEKQDSLEFEHCNLAESLQLVTELLGEIEMDTEPPVSPREENRWIKISNELISNLNTHYITVGQEILKTEELSEAPNTVDDTDTKQFTLENHKYLDLFKTSAVAFHKAVTASHDDNTQWVNRSTTGILHSFLPVQANQRWNEYLEKEKLVSVDDIEKRWLASERSLLIEYVRKVHNEILSPEDAFLGWQHVRYELKRITTDVAHLAQKEPDDARINEDEMEGLYAEGETSALVSDDDIHKDLRRDITNTGNFVHEVKYNTFEHRANEIRKYVRVIVTPMHRKIADNLNKSTYAKQICNVEHAKNLCLSNAVEMVSCVTQQARCQNIVGIATVAKWMRVMRTCSPSVASLYCQSLVAPPQEGSGNGGPFMRKNNFLKKIELETTGFYTETLTVAWKRLWRALFDIVPNSYGMQCFRRRLMVLWHSTSAPVSVIDNTADVTGCVSTMVCTEERVSEETRMPSMESVYPFPPDCCRVPAYRTRQCVIWTMLCVHENFSALYPDLDSMANIIEKLTPPNDACTLEDVAHALDALHRQTRHTPLLYAEDTRDNNLPGAVLACDALYALQKRQNETQQTLKALKAFVGRSSGVKTRDSATSPTTVKNDKRISYTGSTSRTGDRNDAAIPREKTDDRDVAEASDAFARGVANMSSSALNGMRCLLMKAYAQSNAANASTKPNADTATAGSLVANKTHTVNDEFVKYWVTVLSTDTAASPLPSFNQGTQNLLAFLTFLKDLVAFEQQRLEMALHQGCATNVLPLATETKGIDAFAKNPRTRASVFLTEWQAEMQNITYLVRRNGVYSDGVDPMQPYWFMGDMQGLSVLILNRWNEDKRQISNDYMHILEHMAKATQTYRHWKTEVEKRTAMSRTSTPTKDASREELDLEGQLWVAHKRIKFVHDQHVHSSKDTYSTECNVGQVAKPTVYQQMYRKCADRISTSTKICREKQRLLQSAYKYQDTQSANSIPVPLDANGPCDDAARMVLAATAMLASPTIPFVSQHMGFSDDVASEGLHLIMCTTKSTSAYPGEDPAWRNGLIGKDQHEYIHCETDTIFDFPDYFAHHAVLFANHFLPEGTFPETWLASARSSDPAHVSCECPAGSHAVTRPLVGSTDEEKQNNDIEQTMLKYPKANRTVVEKRFQNIVLDKVQNASWAWAAVNVTAYGTVPPSSSPYETKVFDFITESKRLSSNLTRTCLSTLLSISKTMFDTDEMATEAMDDLIAYNQSGLAWGVTVAIFSTLAAKTSYDRSVVRTEVRRRLRSAQTKTDTDTDERFAKIEALKVSQVELKNRCAYMFYVLLPEAGATLFEGFTPHTATKYREFASRNRLTHLHLHDTALRFYKGEAIVRYLVQYFKDVAMKNEYYLGECQQFEAINSSIVPRPLHLSGYTVSVCIPHFEKYVRYAIVNGIDNLHIEQRDDALSHYANIYKPILQSAIEQFAKDAVEMEYTSGGTSYVPTWAQAMAPVVVNGAEIRSALTNFVRLTDCIHAANATAFAGEVPENVMTAPPQNIPIDRFLITNYYMYPNSEEQKSKRWVIARYVAEGMTHMQTKFPAIDIEYKDGEGDREFTMESKILFDEFISTRSYNAGGNANVEPAMQLAYANLVYCRKKLAEDAAIEFEKVAELYYSASHPTQRLDTIAAWVALYFAYRDTNLELATYATACVLGIPLVISLFQASYKSKTQTESDKTQSVISLLQKEDTQNLQSNEKNWLAKRLAEKLPILLPIAAGSMVDLCCVTKSALIVGNSGVSFGRVAHDCLSLYVRYLLYTKVGRITTNVTTPRKVSTNNKQKQDKTVLKWIQHFQSPPVAAI